MVDLVDPIFERVFHLNVRGIIKLVTQQHAQQGDEAQGKISLKQIHLL